LLTSKDESHFGGNVCAALNPHQGFRAVTYVKYTNQPNRAPLDTYDVSKAQANGADSAYDPTYLWVARNQTTVNLPTWAEKFKSDSTVVTDNWYFDRLRPATAIPRILHQGNEKIIYLSLTATEGNTAFANLNSNTFNTTTVPVLLQAIRPTNQNCPAGKTPTYANINSDLAFFGTNNTFTLTQGENVIMVITSYVGSHTFHLHGHDFQVLYHQPEAPTPQAVPDQPDDTKLRNNGYNMPAYPLRRDTLFITRKTYSIIAFKANNPGAWFFHCHNDFHAMSGMAGAFVTGPDLTGKGAPGVWGDTVYNQCRAPGNQGSITGFWRDCLP
jgi:iron transport multicopper oxidase